MTTPKLTDPQRPSSAYIADVLLSEDVAPTKENIGACRGGWQRAVQHPRRLDVARSQDMDAAFWQGNPFAIGYSTYVYGYCMQNDDEQALLLAADGLAAR